MRGQGKPHTEQDQIGRKAGSKRKLRPGACRLGAPNLRVGGLSRAVMRGPEEWSSCRSNPADKIRLTGPAAFLHRRWSLVVGKTVDPLRSRVRYTTQGFWIYSTLVIEGFWPTTNDAFQIRTSEKTMSAPSRRPEI